MGDKTELEGLERKNIAVEQHVEQEQKTDDIRKKKKKIAIGALTGAFAIILILYASILATRTVYSSESEMKRSIIGIYTVYVGDMEYQLRITEKDVTKRCISLGGDYDNKLTILSWNPILGSITMSTDRIFVTKSEDIRYIGTYGRTTYLKGGFWSEVLSGTYTAPNPTAKTTDDLSYDATLVYGNDDVLFAVNEDALSTFFDALTRSSDAAIQELFSSGLIGETPTGTKVAIMKTGISRYKVKLLDGPYAGYIVWVIRESVQLK